MTGRLKTSFVVLAGMPGSRSRLTNSFSTECFLISLGVRRVSRVCFQADSRVEYEHEHELELELARVETESLGPPRE